jgi:hypothetical protein
MLYLQRSIKTDFLPGDKSIIQFKFNDLDKLNNWWLIVKGCDVDICLEDPGQEVDVYLTTDLKTMVQCWMGDKSYKEAITEKSMKVVGPSVLTRNIREWIADSIFAELPPASEI